MAKHKGIAGAVGQVGMLRQLQSLQEDVLRAQEEIAAMTATGTAGGGAVTAVVGGERRVHSIILRPAVVDPEETEMLQDLIVAAVNQGLEQVERMAGEKMSAITGGLGLPGLG